MRSACIVVLLVACGGGKGGGAGSAGVAAQASLEQTCDRAFECQAEFPEGGSSFEQLFGTTETECEANLSEFFDAADIQAAVDAGRIIYDAGDAQVCLDAREAATCAQFWGTDPFTAPPECDTAFVGTVANGGACTIDLECQGASCTDGICAGAREDVLVTDLSPSDQASLCEDFLDNFCVTPGNTFCDDPCHDTGCTPAADNGSFNSVCNGVTVGEVTLCGADGTEQFCTGGPGCIADALTAACL